MLKEKQLGLLNDDDRNKYHYLWKHKNTTVRKHTKFVDNRYETEDGAVTFVRK